MSRLSVVRLSAFTVVALLGLSGLAACKKPGSRLEGVWRGSKAEGVAADVQQAANTFALDTEVSFSGEVLSVRTPRGRKDSKFKVVREDKASTVIVTDADGPKAEETFVFSDDHTMKWQVLDGKTITFNKE